jgi:HSP20 family protein
MRYRRLSYRYAMVVGSGQTLPLGDIWQNDRLHFLVQPGWRPDADTYETATTVEIMVDLAGVEEDDLEVQLFEDALVVEGYRQLPSCQEGAVYHVVGIRQTRPVPGGAGVAGSYARRTSRGALRAWPAPHHPAQACGGRLLAVASGAGPGDFTIPDALPVLPLRDAVVFPLTAVPLGVASAAQAKSINASWVEVRIPSRILSFLK